MLDPHVRRRQKLRNAVQGLLLLGGLVSVAAFLAWMIFGGGGPALDGLPRRRRRGPPAQGAGAGDARDVRGPTAASGRGPQLHRIVRVLAERAGLPVAPGLYYVPSPLTNAFAVGRGEDAGIAVTDGLLRRLTSREVAAVLAHEVSHVRAGDTTVMTVSDSIGRLVHGLSYVGNAVGLPHPPPDVGRRRATPGVLRSWLH